MTNAEAKTVIKNFQDKIADGTWIYVTTEEYGQVRKALEELEKPIERGAGDDYPVIPQN